MFNKLIVDSLTSSDSTSPVTLSTGIATISSGIGISCKGNLNIGVTTSSQILASHLSSSGICSAGYYYGDGANLSGLDYPIGKLFALKHILSDVPHRA